MLFYQRGKRVEGGVFFCDFPTVDQYCAREKPFEVPKHPHFMPFHGLRLLRSSLGVFSFSSNAAGPCDVGCYPYSCSAATIYWVERPVLFNCDVTFLRV